MLLKKGVYPYEYIDCYEKFDEKQLPPIENFYSSLSESNITPEEYQHAQKIWDLFKIQNLAFRKTAMKNYGLDPANGYFTLPNYAWD
eukprot:gene62947-86097_t